MKPSEWAHGHWPEIIAALVGSQFIDGKHHPCPKGEGQDRFRFSNRSGQGNYFCACSDGRKSGFDLVMCVKGGGFGDAMRLVEGIIGKCPRDDETGERKIEPTWAQRLRKETRKSNRSRYLEARGLEVPNEIEWINQLSYFEEGKEIGRYPAMLVPLTNPQGKFLTYHVTYLENGAKAPVGSCRKLLPAPTRLNGAACRLYPWDEGPIGVAEGVETAIAAKMLFDIPVWVAFGTSLLKTWEPPKKARRVLIFGDNDKNFAGQAAAYHLAHRLVGQGLSVVLHFPGEIGDWADVVGDEEIINQLRTHPPTLLNKEK